MSLNYKSLTPEERLYAYTLSSQLTAQTGAIGYLRGDFGRNGAEFRRGGATEERRLPHKPPGCGHRHAGARGSPPEPVRHGLLLRAP